MTYTQTATKSATYTIADVRDVVRQFTTDLKMMASSSGAETQEWAEKTGQDIEVLATEKFVKSVDVTLIGPYGGELRAVEYEVDEDSGQLTSSRPGGVLWPKTAGGAIRVVIRKSRALTDAVNQRLNFSWAPSSADLSHSNLTSSGGRNYVQNGYGLLRKDWS